MLRCLSCASSMMSTLNSFKPGSEARFRSSTPSVRNNTLVPLSLVVSKRILYAISDPCSFSVSYATRRASATA